MLQNLQLKEFEPATIRGLTIQLMFWFTGLFRFVASISISLASNQISLNIVIWKHCEMTVTCKENTSNAF